MFFQNIKKILETLSLILFISSLLITTSAGLERTEKEKKLGVFKEDLKAIGKFKKIETVPKELFPEKLKTFVARSKKSQEEIKRIFVDQKGLLDKYPHQMMKGMAYFEFFYMQQLKDHEKDLERFEIKYPNSGKKVMQKIHNLNQARQTMREAVGLTIESSPEEAIKVYFTMYKLFNQAKTQEIKLSKEEKKKLKIHKEVNKHLALTIKSIEKLTEERLTRKKFLKENQKNSKKLNRSLKKAETFKEYELLSSLIIELPDFTNKNPSVALSGYR